MNESKNSVMTEEKRRTYIGFFCAGLRSLGVHKTILLIVVAAASVIAGRVIVSRCCEGSVLVNFFVDVYTALFVLIAIAAIAAVYILKGAPKGFIKTNRLMLRAHLKNSAGETPFLTMRDAEPESTEIWEFYSRGIPPSAWQDNIPYLESALDAAIVNVTESRDGSHVKLTLKLHPGSWPEKILWQDELLSPKDEILVLGRNRIQQVEVNISVFPHILLAGDTGSGKTMLLQSLLYQALLHSSIVYIADYKGGIDWPGDLWHKHCTFVGSREDLNDILDEIQQELERRRDIFLETGCKNLESFNQMMHRNMPRIIFACDEVAILLNKNGLDDKAKKQVVNIERKLSDLASIGRAYGIHLILATQRPDATILSGFIRNNMSVKICGRADLNLSLLVLDSNDAHERIPKHSRGRFVMSDGTEFLGYYIDFESISALPKECDADD